VEGASVFVLRLGHRPGRDRRVTTHVGLVARAFGAKGMFLTVEDKSVVESLRDVVERWGGEFSVRVASDWRGLLRRWKGVVVHLTMYGEPLDERLEELRRARGEVLVIVGAEKVPQWVFRRADYNISVGSQPHSEVAALAVFLDRFFCGEELRRDFKGRMRIVPSSRGKKVVTE